MPKLIVSPKWIEKIKDAIKAGAVNGVKIDETLTFIKSKQWLILELSKHNIPFKVYNLGAGVCRVTTDTTTCPCCGKELNNKWDDESKMLFTGKELK
jgi:hypothetical protein